MDFSLGDASPYHFAFGNYEAFETIEPAGNTGNHTIAARCLSLAAYRLTSASARVRRTEARLEQQPIQRSIYRTMTFRCRITINHSRADPPPPPEVAPRFPIRWCAVVFTHFQPKSAVDTMRCPVAHASRLFHVLHEQTPTPHEACA